MELIEIAKELEKYRIFIDVFTTLIFIGMGYIALRHFSVERSSNNRDFVFDMVKQLGDEEIRAIRHWILSDSFVSIAQGRDVSKDELAAIQKLAAGYDRIAFICRMDESLLSTFVEFQKKEINLIWERIQPVMTKFRNESGRGDYITNFEWVYEISKKM